jgi:hypothetical protein
MKIEARKELRAELIEVSKGECMFRITKLLNGEVVSEEVRTLLVGDLLRMRLSQSFTYEIDLGGDESTH